MREEPGVPPPRGGQPVIVGKHGAVTVAKVQTPDLHVPVGGAGGDEGAVLVEGSGGPAVRANRPHRKG